MHSTHFLNAFIHFMCRLSRVFTEWRYSCLCCILCSMHEIGSPARFDPLEGAFNRRNVVTMKEGRARVHARNPLAVLLFICVQIRSCSVLVD